MTIRLETIQMTPNACMRRCASPLLLCLLLVILALGRRFGLLVVLALGRRFGLLVVLAALEKT